MRLFLAILPDNGIKDELCFVQKRLQMQGVKGDFTPRENMHLTLAFIGEYGDPGFVSEILGEVTFEPMRLVIDGFGCFDDSFWIGVKEDRGLETNVKRIRKALADNGIPFDKKKFMPHMTLVRKIEYEKGFPTIYIIQKKAIFRGLCPLLADNRIVFLSLHIASKAKDKPILHFLPRGFSVI